MATAMAMAAVLLLFVVAAPVAYSVEYTIPWDIGTSYASWATKKLNVGDVLVFTYMAEIHSVDVVDATSYATCKTAKPLASFTGGTTSIPLTAPGPMYFLCPVMGHCQAGMKLSITVSAAAAPTTPATPPTAPVAAAPAPTNATATPSPSPTTTPTLSPSPSPSVSPSPAVTSPTGSPAASAPSPANSTTSITDSSPGSSGGARSMVGEMNHLLVIGFSVVVAGLAGFMV